MLTAGAAGAVPKFMSTGNPTDTASGVSIVAIATLETVSYYDLNSTLMPTSEGITNESTVVGSEYGFSGPEHPANLVYVKPAETVYHYYMITNEANNLDMPNLYHTFNYYGGATSWLVELYHDGGFRATLEAGTTYTFQPLIADNADTSLYYKVQVAASAANAPSGSGITLLTSFETVAEPVGLYIGGNYFSYGGNASSREGVTEEVQAPNIILTRTSTVDAPLTFTGGIHDNVPGSVITYQMTYSNTGSIPAENCILMDKIPTYANLSHFNTTGTTTNVAITMAAGTATGWAISYSILDNPNTSYGNAADWSGANGGSIGTLPNAYPGGGTTYPNGSGVVPFNAKWVKWEKASVDPSEDNVTITWGVTTR